MSQKNIRYAVFNDTDGVFASPESFETHREARAFARAFRARYERQGYYFTADRLRIPVSELELVIVEVEAEPLG